MGITVWTGRERRDAAGDPEKKQAQEKEERGEERETRNGRERRSHMHKDIRERLPW
jgi:hypothetical protein